MLRASPSQLLTFKNRKSMRLKPLFGIEKATAKISPREIRNLGPCGPDRDARILSDSCVLHARDESLSQRRMACLRFSRLERSESTSRRLKPLSGKFLRKMAHRLPKCAMTDVLAMDSPRQPSISILERRKTPSTKKAAAPAINAEATAGVVPKKEGSG